MDKILKLVDTTNTFLWSYILIIMLISLGLYFTFRTKFVQFRYFTEMFRLLGDGAAKDVKSEGKVSSFQAFCCWAWDSTPFHLLSAHNWVDP